MPSQRIAAALLGQDDRLPAFLLPDLVAENPRGSGFSPLPFDPSGAEVRNAQRPSDPVQDQLAEGVLTGAMLVGGPKMPFGTPTLVGGGVGAALGGANAVADPSLDLDQALLQGAGLGALTGFGAGAVGAGARTGKQAIADALLNRSQTSLARARQPNSAVPPVSGTQTRVELDALGQQIENPNVRAVPGRQGFPTKAEEVETLRRLRQESLGTEQPQVSPFASSQTQGQANADLVRELLIRDRIARALRGER